MGYWYALRHIMTNASKEVQNGWVGVGKWDGVGRWHRLYDGGAWQDGPIARGHNDLWMIQCRLD
jgi:hypothetical protein